MDKGIRNFRCLFSAGTRSIYFFKALVSKVFLMSLQFKSCCTREMGRASPGQLTQTPAVLKHFEIPFISNAKREWVITKVSRRSKIKPSSAPRNALVCSVSKNRLILRNASKELGLLFRANTQQPPLQSCSSLLSAGILETALHSWT